MKKLIALLAVLGMMFSSFAYAANAVTEESIVSNHTQEIAQIKTSVKSLAGVFAKTTTGEQFIKALQANMLPLELPELTQDEQAKLEEAEKSYQDALVKFINSLEEDEVAFLLDEVAQSVGNEMIENMSEDKIMFATISAVINIALKNCNLSEEETLAFVVYGQWKLIEEMKQ